jgi:PKD repeat protein
LFKQFVFSFVSFAMMKNLLLYLFIALTSFYAKKGLGQCVKSTPYTQNFDGSNWVAQSSWLNSGSIPSCWNRLLSTGNYLWMAGPPALGTINSGPSADHTSGTGGYAVAEGWSTSGTFRTVTHLITPPIDLSNDTVPRLKFFYHMYGADIDLLDVRVRKVGTTSWTQLHTVTSSTASSQFTSQNSAWRKHVESLAQWAGDTVQIRFSAKRNTSFSWWTQSRVALDDITIEETPSCDQPINPTISNLLSTTVNVNWTTLNTNQIGYQIQYAQGNSGASGGTIVNSTTKPGSLSGLSPNTTYSVRVRDICSAGDTSVWSSYTTFITQCSFATAPFTENFDGASWDPSSSWNAQGDLDQCWLDQGSATQFWTPGPPAFNWTQTGPAGDHTTGSGQYMMNQVTTTFVSGTNPRLISPWIDLDTLVSPELSFYYHGFGTSMGDFDVYVQKLGGTWSALWDTSGSTHSSKNAAWTEKIIALGTSYAGDTVRIRFDYTNTQSSFYTQFAIDDVKIDEEPSCPKPANTAVTAVGVMAAQLDWTSGGASNYQLRYREVGTNAWSWTTANTSAKGIGMLSAQTTYEWQVRDSCGTGDVSGWLDGPRFRTNCTFYTAPFVEQFSSSTTWVGPAWPDQNGEIDDCWNRSDTLDYFWTGGGTTAHYFGTGPSGDHTSGSGGYAFARSATPFSNTADTEFRTPLIDLDTLQSPELTFWYHMYGAAIDKLRIYIKASGQPAALLKTINGQQQTSSNASWTKETLSLSAYENDTVQIIFKAWRDGTGSFTAYQAATSIDDIKIDEPTTCPIPNISANNVTFNGADITWSGTANSSALEYDIQGFTLGTGTRVAAANRAYSIGSLQPSTTYTVWVQDTCTSSLVSLWDSVSFTTLPCPPISATGTVTLNGTAITGTSSTTAADSTVWFWGDTTQDTGSTAQHTYSTIFGSMNVYQVVYSSCGSVDSLLHAITVCDTMSIVAANVINGLTVDFNTIGSQGTGLIFDWSYGDGGGATANSAPSHTYTSSGTYIITLTASSLCGDTIVLYDTVEVCTPVTLMFTESASGSTFNFTATPANLTNYNWDFGDGSTGSGLTVSNTYSTNGTFTVVLTATDSCGTEHTYSKDVATCDPPIGNFNFNIVSTSSNGMTVNFFASSNGATQFHWYWGDGTNDQGSSPNAQHTYGVISLQYTVRLLLINDCGDTTVITRSLTEVGMNEYSTALDVYPNPTLGYVQLEFSAAVTGEIELYNAAGLKLAHETVTEANDFKLDLHSLPAGSYEIRISTDEQLWRRRILKL